MKRFLSIHTLLILCITGLCIAGLCIAGPAAQPASAASLQAEAVVEQTTVYQGEPFMLRIRVSGSDQVEPPDSGILENMDGFSVTYQGGSGNNSTSITIVNGKMTRNIKRGYVFSYELIPQKTGTLTIPPIEIRADAQSVKTRAVRIHVRAPGETDDVKLRVFLSKNHCYTGEPVTLTARLYLRKDVRTAVFTLPALNRTDWFYVIDPKAAQKQGKKYYRIPVNNEEVIALQGQETLDGTLYSTVSFSKILIPGKPGAFTLDQATVACEVLTGYRANQRRNPFGDEFFSDFFNTRQGVYQKVVAPSPAVDLTVRELPVQGRPDNFAGHIGQYGISATASPLEVSVGDPITLTITLSGPSYLEHVNLPPLENQKNLARQFKIPEERATGEIQNHKKIFTQTIRALSADVTHIPAIQLPYFDTENSTYKIAETRPIPLTVKETRVVTAMDAEGRSLSAAQGRTVETWDRGIAYNYEDASVLEDQRTGLQLIQTPAWTGAIAAPPVLYLMVLAVSAVIRRKKADPGALMARKAFRRLSKTLGAIKKTEPAADETDRILKALCQYLGARLGLSSFAIVYSDAAPALAEKGASSELLHDLEKIFTACEAGRYAGARDRSASGEPVAELSEKTLKTAAKIEKLCK